MEHELKRAVIIAMVMAVDDRAEEKFRRGNPSNLKHKPVRREPERWAPVGGASIAFDHHALMAEAVLTSAVCAEVCGRVIDALALIGPQDKIAPRIDDDGHINRDDVGEMIRRALEPQP
jgi:hypothetical protein